MNIDTGVTDSIAEIERLYQQLPKNTTPKLTEEERKLQDKRVKELKPYVDSTIRVLNFAANHREQFPDKEQDDVLDCLNMAALYLTQGDNVVNVIETVVIFAYLLGKYSKDK